MAEGLVPSLYMYREGIGGAFWLCGSRSFREAEYITTLANKGFPERNHHAIKPFTEHPGYRRRLRWAGRRLSSVVTLFSGGRWEGKGEGLEPEKTIYGPVDSPPLRPEDI